MELGRKIKAIRERRGWSQNELSRLSGVRQALISELEAGKKTDTTGQVLRRLGQTLGVTVDYLVGMYDERETQPEDGASELWTAAVA
jgi:transcriptional regulator with XRE-family HTH domain